MSMVQATIGLGSNLKDPVSQLKQAIQAISHLPASQLLRQSTLYKSKAMVLEGADEQPDYINAVVLLETELPASELLAQLQSIENQQGRIREQRWGARTLDLDILTYGNAVINEADLQVPHMGIAQRNFVLVPLQAMMGEDFDIPGKGKIGELVKQCSLSGLEKLAD